MVSRDPTQQFVVMLSALLFLGIAVVTIAHRFAIAPTSPDPIATYGVNGK